MPFGTMFNIGNNLSLKMGIDLLAFRTGVTQKTHNVLALKHRHSIPEKMRVEPGKLLVAFEHDIGCPFAFVSRPIIVQGEIVKKLGMKRINALLNASQQLRPVAFQLFIKELLGPGDVLDISETISSANITDIFIVKLPGQPFSAVNAQLHRQGQPRLDARVHEAEYRMNHVVIYPEALSLPGNQLKLFCLPVFVNIKALTWFNRGKQTNQAILYSITCCNRARIIFLVNGRTPNIFYRPTSIDSHLLGGANDFSTEMLCPLAEILEKDIFPIQVTHHSADRSNQSYGTPKQKPVKPVNDTDCGLLVFSQKRLHETAPFGDCCGTTKYCHCFWGSFFFAAATISTKRSYHE